MRIVLLSHRYLPNIGGIEIVVKHLAGELSRDHHVSIVAGGLPREERVSREDGATVHRFAALDLSDRIGIPYPVPLGPGIGGALDAIRRADVLHVHGSLYPASILAALLARRRGTPLIVTEHVGFVPYRASALNAVQGFAWRCVGDFVAGTASALVACGERVARWMQKRYPRSRVHLVPNGVDSERFRPLDPSERQAARAQLGLPLERTLVLFVGRESEKKNLAPVLRIPRRDFDLVLCGAERSIEADGVHDVGTLPYRRMPALLGCVDFLVHAGTGEGFPLVVQESLACGVPVVLLWDEGYAPVIDRKAVRACDSLEHLCEEVQSLARDRTALEDLRRGARPYAQRRWSWSRTAAAYVDLYRQAMGVRGRA